MISGLLYFICCLWFTCRIRLYSCTYCHQETNKKTLEWTIKDFKDYYEIPELINEYNLEIKKDFYIPKDDNISKEQENTRFNEISGGLYQEFEVYKINKYKTKKKRI